MKYPYQIVEEVATRLRLYEQDGENRYFSVSYINESNESPQIIGSDRLEGEKVFRDRINQALHEFKATKIFVHEYRNKANNGKDAVNIIEIPVEREVQKVIITQEQSSKQEQRKQTGNQSSEETVAQVFGRLDTMKQELRVELAQEYQLIKEREEKHKLIEQVAQLTSENKELEEDNTKLFELNEELSEKAAELQKYVPEGLTVANVSVTKMLGSVLGSATESFVKNVVTKKPEKVKEIIGEMAFGQLAGLVGDDEELEELPEEEINTSSNTSSAISEEEQEQIRIVHVLNDINSKAPYAMLNKLQLLYYYLLNEDESLDQQKLEQLVEMAKKFYDSE